MRLKVDVQSWPLAKPFAISRGVKTVAEVVVAELIDDDGHRGWGECVPYARYGETVAGVAETLRGLEDALADGLSRDDLQQRLPPGAARNALDCALWDLDTKRTGRRIWDQAGLALPEPTVTAVTVSLGTPEEMAAQAAALASPTSEQVLLKLKLDGARVMERVGAVRAAAPQARLIIDPNEGWSVDVLRDVMGPLADLGVEMIEQPVPADGDDGLRDVQSAIPLCADEACHTAEDLQRLKGLYDMVNIKLDKTGGLTGAIALAHQAEEMGFGLMVGCMVATSLAMAPAAVLASRCRVVDLDGPLLLRKDRTPGLSFSGGRVHPPEAELWG